MSASPLDPAFAIPSDFVFGEVPSGVTFAARTEAAAPPEAAAAPSPVTASLGPLAAFTGTFAGNGFNTIFGRTAGRRQRNCRSPPPTTTCSS